MTLQTIDPMSNGLANLPQEIITDILIRLPVKSIGGSRCVSKPWLSLLTSYEFIKTHLARHTPEQKLLLLCSSSQSLFTTDLHPASCFLRELIFCDEDLVSFAGSCNGLVLVVTEGNGKCLINCTTEECFEIPNSLLALDPSISFSMHGFGYDSLSDDYKIVSLSYYKTDNGHEPDCADTFVDIYSAKMRSWRRFGISPNDHAVPKLSSGVFVNGSLHWMGLKSLDQPSEIAAFDLGSEEFKEISAPASIDNDKFAFNNKLVEFGGCLGIVADLYDDGLIEIWFMNSYSSAESWTKITIDMPFICWKPLLFS